MPMYLCNECGNEFEYSDAYSDGCPICGSHDIDEEAKSSVWLGIESAPMDGTKIVGWFVPNEVHAPDKAIPRTTSYVVRRWKDGTGKPFGLWLCEEGCVPMSYAPTHWMPMPNSQGESSRFQGLEDKGALQG